MELADITQAKFIEITHNVPEKGTWKVTETKLLRDENGKVLVARMQVDQDLSKVGDERIIEWQQEAPREITVLKVFSFFQRADAESWPPPRNIEVNVDGVQVKFVSLNTQGGPHDPFTGFISNQNNLSPLAGTNGSSGSGYGINRSLVEHWEYQDETGTKFLQVYLEDGVVYMSTGYVVPEAFCKII